MHSRLCLLALLVHKVQILTVFFFSDEISECTRDLSFAQQDIRELEETVVLDDEHALGFQFTCFTSTKVQILTQKALVGNPLTSMR